jgi:transketolase
MSREAVLAEPAAVGERVDRLCIDTIRTLTMDAVQRANSGHPGMPMAMAPVAYLLYTRYMRHNPRDPAWPDRDRFVLSAGHGSMLLYSVLHLCGYDLSLEEIKRFRQWGSLTPGHPERILGGHGTPGVETTTGPLGQGFANGVGMAMAERFLRERHGAEIMDHRVFAICSDGDLMEGVAAEAASIAGHLGLGRLVYVYDDNHISIDGDTALSFDTEDVGARFRSYGWHVEAVEDANDLGALSRALEAAIAEEERPSLIRVRSTIAWPAPNARGTAAAHGATLGRRRSARRKKRSAGTPTTSSTCPTRCTSSSGHASSAAASTSGSGSGAWLAGVRRTRLGPQSGSARGKAGRPRASPKRCPRSTRPKPPPSQHVRPAARRCRRSRPTCRRCWEARGTWPNRPRPSSGASRVSVANGPVETCISAYASTRWARS